MLIDTTRFGQIEVPETEIIHFPKGLYGLNDTRYYCLLQHDEQGLFHWLQAVDDPNLAMILTQPMRFLPDYEVYIPDEAAELLSAQTAEDVVIYSGVTIDREVGADTGRKQVCVNLLGPLVINPVVQIGMQLIQDSARYSTRVPLLRPLRGHPWSEEREHPITDESPLSRAA